MTVTLSQYEALKARRDALLVRVQNNAEIINGLIAQSQAATPAGFEMQPAHAPFQGEPIPTQAAGQSRTWGGMTTPEEQARVAVQQQTARGAISETLEDLTRPESRETMQGGLLASMVGPDLAATTANLAKMPVQMARGIGEQVGGFIKAMREGNLSEAGYVASNALAGLVPGQMAVKAMSAALGDRAAREELRGMEFMPALDALFAGQVGKFVQGKTPQSGIVSIRRDVPAAEAGILRQSDTGPQRVPIESGAVEPFRVQTTGMAAQAVPERPAPIPPGVKASGVPETASVVPEPASGGVGKGTTATRLPDAGETIPKPPVETAKTVAEQPVPQGKQVSLRKAEGAAIRKRLDMDKLEAPTRESFADAWDQAAESGMADNAIAVARAAVESKRPLTAVEHAGAVQKYVQLSDELTTTRKALADAAKSGNDVAVTTEMSRTMDILSQIDDLTRATDAAGTEAGRALSVRRLRGNVETLDLGTVLQAARTKKGRALSQSEVAKYETLIEKNKTLEKQNEALRIESDKAAEAKAKGVAETVAEVERHRAIKDRITVKREKIIKDREDINRQLAELGYRLNDVTGVSAEGSYLIGKLAANYIHEGIAAGQQKVHLGEVVGKVLKDLNNPDITPRDVYGAMNARSPKVQANARQSANRQVGELKTQARLLLEIEKAEGGVFDGASKKPLPMRSAEVKALQKKLTQLRTQAFKSGMAPDRLERAVSRINELQDQLDGHYRNLRKPRPEATGDLAAMQQKMKELRQEMRAEDTLADLQEQLRTGEFKITERPTRYTSPELERNQIAIKRARGEIRAQLEAEAPMTARRAVAETTGFLRTMKAIADMSGTLRQGLFLAARRPVAAAKNFGQAFKATFDKYKADQIDNAIRQDPRYYQYEKAGVEFTDLDAVLSKREEHFMSRVAERIPVFGEAVKASERHMATFLNLIRKSAMDDFLDAYPNATAAELKTWGEWVNVASGRGTGKFTRKNATELSTFIFAPRFANSRIQIATLQPLIKAWKDPRVRKEIAKDYVAVAALGATALTLAKLGGAELEDDPRSSDFGKIRVGDTRVDIWGGIQQPVRLVLRLGAGATDNAGWSGKDLRPNEKDVDPVEMFYRFAAFKLAPSITLPRSIYTGKTAVGEDITPSEAAIRAAVPLVVEDIIEAWQQRGVGGAAAVGGLVFLGVGANTYPDSKTVMTRKVREALDSGDIAKANSLKAEFARKHPGDKIGDISTTRALTLGDIRKAVDEKDLEKARKIQENWNDRHPESRIVVVK